MIHRNDTFGHRIRDNSRIRDRMTCLSPQHRGGLDAGDTDSADLTPGNHGPHRMNRKQMANDYKNAYKVPQLLFLTHQTISNSYPNTATCA